MIEKINILNNCSFYFVSYNYKDNINLWKVIYSFSKNFNEFKQKTNNKELRIRKNKIIKNLFKLVPKNKSLLNKKIYFFNFK